MFSRLKVVQYVHFTFFILKTLDSKVCLDFTKLQLAYNLRTKFLMKSSNIRYFSKKRGFSIYFSLFNFYDLCFQALYDISVTSFVELNLDKFTCGFRPYRDYLDFFCILKNKFRYLVSYQWFSFLTVLPLISNSNILNNFPVEKRFLKSWLKNGLLEFNMKFFNSFLSDFVYFNNICFSLINFIFSGMV